MSRSKTRLTEAVDQRDFLKTGVAKAHELGMGIAAMKLVGGGVLGAWSGYGVSNRTVMEIT